MLDERDVQALLNIFGATDSPTSYQSTTIEQHLGQWRVTLEVDIHLPSHSGPVTGEWSTRLEDAALSAAMKL